MKNYQIYFLVDVDVAELHVLNSHRTETQQTTKKKGGEETTALPVRTKNKRQKTCIDATNSNIQQVARSVAALR